MATALFLILASSVVAGEAWSPRPNIIVQPDGRIQAGDLSLEPTLYDEEWRITTVRDVVDGPDGNLIGTWRRSGTWHTVSSAGRFSEAVTLSGNDAIRVDLQLNGSGPVKMFCLSLALNGTWYRGGGLRVDGRDVRLPVQSPQPQLWSSGSVRKIEIPVRTGGWLEISGDLAVMLQDNQQWGDDSFSVRLVASEAQALSATVRLRSLAVSALPLGAAASISRRDGDGDGAGWTGQGDNDLRALPAGPLRAAGFPFVAGDNAIVLSRDRIADRPHSAEVTAIGSHGTCLYLLHALAWAPQREAIIGRILLHYQDGGVETVPVRSGRDVVDWWNPPDRLANAALGWSSTNPHARIGLVVSRFPIPDRPLDRIALEVEAGTAWMVVGMSIGEEASLPRQVPDTIIADRRWHPIDVHWEVEAASALDLSALTVAPVPGRLVVDGAHFAIAGHPGEPVRLLGANLCFSANFPDKSLAERMAVAMRRLGYNAVRFHHYDGGLVKPGGDGTELDPERLDRLDYLMAQCKAQGLWFTTDLYVSRRIPAGAIPEFAERGFGQEFKALLPLLPSAMDNWKRFATNLLGHANPYTGRTWGSDPALATLSMVNEDNLNSTIDGDPGIAALYDRHFAVWLADRPEGDRMPQRREPLRRRWLRDLQATAYATMRAHVRSLGVEAPTTSCNFLSDWWSISVRDGFDFVDNHAYHDHPGFPVQSWSLPYAFHQRSAVADLLEVPAALASTRRLDRPFTVSELNYVFPNHHRAEYAAAVAAVAGRQDWDAIWRFALAGDVRLLDRPGRMADFESVCDPIAILGERALALLWRRGDVRAALEAVALVYDPAKAAESVGGPALAALAVDVRIGCLPAAIAQETKVPGLCCLLESRHGGKAPSGSLPILPGDGDTGKTLVDAGLLADGDIGSMARRVRSGDGIVTDAGTGMLSVATPRSVAVVLPGRSSWSAAGIAISNHDPDAATVVLAALDGDLATGKRLLLLHLTDAQNSGIRFGNRKHTLLEALGSLPVLVRAGAVTVRIPVGAKTKAWALDLTGARREEVMLIPDGGQLRLDVAVVRAWGACLAWEITRE